MSTKDTFARLAAGAADDPFDFIGRSEPKGPSGSAMTPVRVPRPNRTKQITARLDEDLHRRLKLYLASTGEEQQELIARLLAAHFDSHSSV